MKPPRRATLSKKLFISFVVIFFIPTAAVSLIISYLFGASQYKSISAHAANNAKLISAYLGKYFTDIDNITKAPYYHSYFQSRIPAGSLTPYEQNQISGEIGKLFQVTTYSREDFEDLVVMSDGWVVYFNSSDWYQYLSTVNPLEAREWYQEALKSAGRIALTPQEDQLGEDGLLHTDHFFISRSLNNLFFPEQDNVIMVNLRSDALGDLFSSLSSQASVMVLLTNDSGKLIYSDSPVPQELVPKLGSPRLSYGKEDYLAYSQHLEEYPLTVHVLLSTSYVFRQIAAFMGAVALCYLAGALAAYLLFCKNNRWIEKDTYHLKSVLKDMERGNLAVRCHSLPVQEFNEIGLSINAMAARLQEKIRNEYELNLAHKELQFQALQSQIQPHFIINTIYSFITLNQIGEQEALNDGFYSFARLLRYVLSRDKNTSLGRELDFLRDYCSLCLLRFGSRMSFQIECADALRELPLPKLLLQPLVENAVIHGIEPSETPCALYIEGLACPDAFYIIITDNGVGFSAEDLDSPRSIGIRNVTTRLALWEPQAKLYMYRAGGTSFQILIIPRRPAEVESK